MIRIIGVQRHAEPSQEFVLLQNQGALRAKLRGHIVMGDQAISDGDLRDGAHVFSDDALVPAGMYVLLFTGCGTPRWGKTKDGQMVYYAFMNRNASVWEKRAGPLHLLAPQHTYSERGASLVLR